MDQCFSNLNILCQNLNRLMFRPQTSLELQQKSKYTTTHPILILRLTWAKWSMTHNYNLTQPRKNQQDTALTSLNLRFSTITLPTLPEMSNPKQNHSKLSSLKRFSRYFPKIATSKSYPKHAKTSTNVWKNKKKSEWKTSHLLLKASRGTRSFSKKTSQSHATKADGTRSWQTLEWTNKMPRHITNWIC